MEQYIEFVGNHPILSISFIVVLALLVYSFVGDRLRNFKSAGPADAIKLINQEDAVMLDVRDDNEYRKGHIVNAVHIPMSYLSDRVGELEKYKDKPIIVGCRSGQRSAQACGLLKKKGFENVYNLRGGMMAWQSDNLPITKK